MFIVTFPDGSNKSFIEALTGIQLAKAIAPGLAKIALAIKINGVLSDLSEVINYDCAVEIITNQSEAGLEIIRHDCAHILAQAVKELYPHAQITIGPTIENGFYYDLSLAQKLNLDDLTLLENKMKEIVKRDNKITKEVWQRDDAVSYFKSIGEHYKAELIAAIPVGEAISLYRQGEFIDLCRGPHALSTGYKKAFKLLKVAGAYWRGDSKNEMLQRIYGTAWADQAELDSYLHRLEEAEKRDHRRIGKDLGLFHLQEEASGQVFWHDKGWTLYLIIENYIRQKIKQNGYIEVKTPILADRILWEKSGHWDKFQENMFIINNDDKFMALKPMNCPLHIQIFKQNLKSYRDLPLRMAEFGCCHRNESSGSLHGIMRVKGMTQDDAHIFCSEQDINQETANFIKLLQEVYSDFGFKEILIRFSTRPEKFAGSITTWNKAEEQLKSALDATKLAYVLNPGEGAFYGPKLEFVLKDAIGRSWQCGTLQLDFVLPERLEASYIGSDGQKHIPVMLHRAILGSLERFIGILIEEHCGKFPLWLAPVQVALLPITDDNHEYAKKIYDLLEQNDIRTVIDYSSEKINYKIRQYSLQKIPFIFVVGKKEMENFSVSVRSFGSEQQEILQFSDSLAMLKSQIKSKI